MDTKVMEVTWRENGLTPLPRLTRYPSTSLSPGSNQRQGALRVRGGACSRLSRHGGRLHQSAKHCQRRGPSQRAGSSAGMNRHISSTASGAWTTRAGPGSGPAAPSGVTRPDVPGRHRRATTSPGHGGRRVAAWPGGRSRGVRPVRGGAGAVSVCCGCCTAWSQGSEHPAQPDSSLVVSEGLPPAGEHPPADAGLHLTYHQPIGSGRPWHSLLPFTALGGEQNSRDVRQAKHHPGFTDRETEAWSNLATFPVLLDRSGNRTQESGLPAPALTNRCIPVKEAP